MRALAVLLLAVAVASPALAGSPDAPEVADPAGDAGPNGVALPAGTADVDFVAAWFDTETDTTIDLVMQTAGPAMNRPSTIWFQDFDSNGTTYRAGYIHQGGGLPMFGYIGHFVCVASDIPRSCIALTGTNSGDTIRLTLPRENISNPARGGVLAIIGGAAASGSFYGPDSVTWDTTPAGLPYVLAVGAGGVVLDDPDLEALPGGATNATVAPSGGAQPSGGEQNAVPAPGLALVAASLGLLALARRRF